MTAPKTISLVVPFYNEGGGVDSFARSISAILADLAAYRFEIICIDDGSRDSTLHELLMLHQRDPRFTVLELSRNFGKEAAMTAGIDAALGDAVIPIDADLQDPPELIAQMIALWEQGAEVVLAKRSDRSSDSYLKRQTASLFYRFHNALSGIKIPENVGDFRLMDRVVIEALRQLPERQRFMKGLFAWVGFKTVTLDYSRQAREVGQTKFSGWKLWNFALEGITSFSTAPLRVMTYLGIIGTLITSLYALYIVVRTLLHGVDVPGYASLLVAILFTGSLQLIGMGILGEYVGRIYMESKQRPIYVIRHRHRAQAKDADADTVPATGHE
ncbi:putative glycosyltransferase [Herbaspirillum sp. GW103]|jgi:glycosyltransferase involved in cell wall biosynthesis|uniref:glycosyltransferase family 2 protein n=1 Tax=unclassified Herbaspirillum TaxID=2624150 RepID=UPI00025E4FFA|nr:MULTISPECIES: glycosyltransferase family 2 protein [unclassified Herbaspirillum]EIJ48515.1 putative glycosyltransferase [Herbaspirillum sp. GW103]NUT63034.1 glycosyltransferase family 2 protein [Herbaspirillum sp. C9C3]